MNKPTTQKMPRSSDELKCIRLATIESNEFRKDGYLTVFESDLGTMWMHKLKHQYNRSVIIVLCYPRLGKITVTKDNVEIKRIKVT